MFTQEDIKKMIMLSLIVLFGIIVFQILDHFESTLNFMIYLFSIFTPILGGFVLAYILNIPMKAIESKLVYKLKVKPGIKRVIALLATLILVLGLISLSIYFVLPQLISSLQQLQIEATSDYFTRLETYIQEQVAQLNLPQSIVDQILMIWTTIVSGVTSFLLGLADQALSGFGGLIMVIFNTIISMVLGFYILLSKERLLKTLKKVFYAFTPKTFCDQATKYIKIINHAFENFIRGQIVEAFILGVVCYIGMLIFRFEYPLVISFLVGITNIIPLFGPYIGAVPSLLLLVLVNPISALWFIVFLIILQQIESNLIYPRVVGSNMGISGFWILVAVVVGNSLFGILGILLGIPLLSSLYIIVKERAEHRLKEKDIVIES
jgi:predicted PurR-regulated permease PerM